MLRKKGIPGVGCQVAELMSELRDLPRIRVKLERLIIAQPEESENLTINGKYIADCINVNSGSSTIRLQLRLGQFVSPNLGHCQ